MKYVKTYIAKKKFGGKLNEYNDTCYLQQLNISSLKNVKQRVYTT